MLEITPSKQSVTTAYTVIALNTSINITNKQINKIATNALESDELNVE
jgi:hypothetical protein